MGNIPYVDILILAMIAVFILNRLRNVLGKKTGNETDIVEKYNYKKNRLKETRPDKIVNSQSSKEKSDNLIFLHENSKLNSVLNEIMKADRSFELQQFMRNAKNAFEFIINAYSNEKLKTLESLLEKNIYEAYKKEINSRIERKEDLDITIVGLEDPVLVDVKLKKSGRDRIATMKLEYKSEQIHTIKNDKDKIVDGDANQILEIKENWTFVRKLNSKNPNWSLLEISET